MQPLGPSEVDAESIDVWVVSHGGVASNALCDHMQKQGLRTRPEKLRPYLSQTTPWRQYWKADFSNSWRLSRCNSFDGPQEIPYC